MTDENLKTILSDETFLFYGRPKIGKSTLASQFPSPVFIATEPGLKYINVPDAAKKYVYTWNEYLELTDDLEKKEHGYFTYIIDTLDNLWNFCSEYVCSKYDKEHPSEIGSQGKGWSVVRDEFKKGLSKINDCKKCVLFLAHACMKEVGKENSKYTFVTLNLPGKAVEAVMGFPNHVLYLAPGQDKEEGRYIYTDGNKFFEAGSRNPNLASKGKIKLDYNELINSMKG